MDGKIACQFCGKPAIGRYLDDATPVCTDCIVTANRPKAATEYEAWANGDLSEISDEAMCYGSEKYRLAHPERCG
jgi:hypothetical protein